eukprot:4190555-Prymnesium_polylepis.1
MAPIPHGQIERLCGGVPAATDTSQSARAKGALGRRGIRARAEIPNIAHLAASHGAVGATRSH